MTKLVAKTDPRELEKQREAREMFIKRAQMANMSYGADPSTVDPRQGLLSPPATGGGGSAPATEGQLLRNQAFASALGVVPTTVRNQQFNQGWARPVDSRAELDDFGNELNAANYPDSLIIKARERMELTLKLERKWKAFLADDTAASLPLNKMDRPARIFTHEYSDFWKLHTESFDPEPKRYIHCVKLKDTGAPRPLLSDAARNWRGPKPVVFDQTDHALKQTAGQTPREFPPPPDREPLALKPRSHPPGFENDTGDDAKQATLRDHGVMNSRSDPLFTGRERPRLTRSCAPH